MSRSWAELFSPAVLYLGPDRVSLSAGTASHPTGRRGAGATVPATPDWPGALAALQTLLAVQPIKGRVAVVLASHFAPLWLLPGTPTRLNFEETRGWVEAQAAERFGELAANWHLAFLPAPAGDAILVSGFDRGHWAELLRVLSEAGVKTASVTSWPAQALARYGGRATARLALVESGRLTLVSLRRGEAVALDSARGEAMPEVLAELLPRAALIDGLDAAPCLLVGTGVAGEWGTTRVLANTPQTALLPGHGAPDFLQRRPLPPLAAWLLLAAGIGLAALAGTRYTTLSEQLAAVPETAVAGKPRPARPAAAPEVAATARPWGALLNRLETGRPQGIALLTLRGDARRGEARLSAEARSEADMLAWLKSLRGEADFSNASLTRHEIQDDEGRHPVRFDLQFGWGQR